MRIAHVINSLQVGGAETMVAALCRLHASGGHTLEVHCLESSGPIALQLSSDGVAVHVHGPASKWILVWRLYRAFRRWRPDVVHCHNMSATVLAAMMARLAGTRVVVSTRHNLAALPYRLRGDLKFWITVSLFCDRVVAVCETARKNMTAGARAVAHKVVTIRNGAYALPADKTADLAERGFILISVGRLTAVKDYPTLLRSVAVARRRVPDLALWLLGDGAEAATLKRIAAELDLADTVRFLGERRDVGNWLVRANVFVLSSASEGLPMAILEAMAAGLPSIVTNVGGMPEIIELSGAGKIVPPNDEAALASAIVEFAERRDELEGLGRRAASCYQRHFTPQRMATDYLNLYEAFRQRVRV